MTKYIATIENTAEATSFDIYFNDKIGTLLSGDDFEIYDMSVYNDEGEKITQFSDKQIVETVYGLYNGGNWEIVNCIEYDE